MTITFDAKHRPQELEGKIFLWLSKPGKPGYHVLNQSSLSPKKLGPFKIVRKVSPLAYDDLGKFVSIAQRMGNECDSPHEREDL
jgi:hypothetical protein